MAPEVFFMEKYDMKCDVWSLGIILFELCTFERKIYDSDKKIPPRYSQELQETVKLMLQSNPAERPNIKTVCHIHEFHRKMNAGGSKGGSHSIAPAQMSAKDGNGKTDNTDSGYQSASSSSHKEKGKTQKSVKAPDSSSKTPLHENSTDQLYISVGILFETKQVYRLGGKEMEDKVLLTDTSYIADKCWCWTLGSDLHKQILLIHPFRTSVIYIHVKEQRHAKVDLNEIAEWDSGRRIEKIKLIGRNLLLGECNEDQLYMFELVVTQKDASIKSDTKWGPVKTTDGTFASLCLPKTDGEQQNDQLHLITAECNRDDDYTVLREYKVGLFGVGDFTRGSSNQMCCSFKVRGKLLFLHCVLHEQKSCPPVLIGRNFSNVVFKMLAIELDKKQ